MTHRQLAIAGFCLVALFTGLVVWQIWFAVPAVGRVSVAFLGMTNDAMGATAALFQLTNGMVHNIGFSAGPIELQGSEGWPKGSNHTVYVATHLGPAYKVGAGQTQCFSVSITNVNASIVWRVPVVYANIGSRLDAWLDKVKVVLKRPVAGVAWWTYTPEIVGLSNQPMQPTPR
jgi:hypothetical protein